MNSREEPNGADQNLPHGESEPAPGSLTPPPRQGRPDERREIRVFISSTFRDLMRERDLLVKQAFPALRRKCAARFVTFTEVDLRWGITEEQAAEGKVLPLCLAEIERSRPYFLGLLGERYGWIPDAIPTEVIEQEPWLKEHLHGRTSVTELEILHGVLNNPAMSGHAFFYFRDPGWIKTLPADERLEMIERDIPADIAAHGETGAALRTAERKDKLAALKERIRRSGLPVVENYRDPEALAAMVQSQFEELIDRLYPESAVPDPLDREADAHEVYARHKLFACIDRPGHLAALHAFASAPHTGQGLVVTGESGGGKSSLLAAWARDWAKDHRDEFVYQHYFGATPESASPDGFLRRLLGELKRRFDLADEIPSQPDKMREALPLWLAQTVGKGRIVLVLDALNQVQGDEPDRRLNWLPRHFPAHVTVVASALEGSALEALRGREWLEHRLPPAGEAEIAAMMDAYLGVFARKLRADLRQKLVAAPGSKNPLFLRTLLEELRQFGSFEELPARVAHYLEAATPPELFLRVLHRWQEDFDAGIGLIGRALTHLWAARRGLSEPEWLELLVTAGAPLPRAMWTPLFLALEPHLSQRAALFTFGHDFLRQAVEKEFVPNESVQKAAHVALANYFEMQEEMTSREAAEWPYQLRQAEAWDRLQSCLTDFRLFSVLYDADGGWELTSYWLPLRARGRDMGLLYLQAFERRDDAGSAARFDDSIAIQLCRFLLANACYDRAESLIRPVMEARERAHGSDHPETLRAVFLLAGTLKNMHDFSGAEPLYRRALEGCERTLGPEHADTLDTLHDLARLLQSKDDQEGAYPLFRRVLEVQERTLGPEHHDTLRTMHNLALLLSDKGDLAEQLMRRVLEARVRTLGTEHNDTLNTMGNLAAKLSVKGDLDGAEPLYRRTLQARERTIGPDHPITLGNMASLAGVLVRKGDSSEVESLLRRALEGMERVLGPDDLKTIKNTYNLARLLHNKGDLSGAEPLYRRALAAAERTLDPDDHHAVVILTSLSNLLRKRSGWPLLAWFFPERRKLMLESFKLFHRAQRKR